MGQVRGPVALVSGGGRGIGRAAALALAAAGHRVVVNDTGVALDGSAPDSRPARSVVEEIEAMGGEALASTTDARTRAGAETVVAEVVAWAGEVPTVFVHGAGTLRDAMVHRASDDDWAEVLGSHLGVAIELTRAITPAVREGRFGRIVYLGGAAGLVGSVGQASYAVAKAGLFGLTRALSLEMAGRDVCVNYVVPFAFTRMTESIPPVTDELRDYLASAPLATPADIGSFIAWLCSAEAAGVSGQVLGARGAEIAVWSQPRPVRHLVETAGWEGPGLTRHARPALEPHFTPLESEFELFGTAPVAVARA